MVITIETKEKNEDTIKNNEDTNKINLRPMVYKIRQMFFSKRCPDPEAYIEDLSLYIGFGIRAPFRNFILIVSTLFFFSFYSNDHLLWSESSRSSLEKVPGSQSLYRERGLLYRLWDQGTFSRLDLLDSLLKRWSFE